MGRPSPLIWVLFFSLLLSSLVSSEQPVVKQALVDFLRALSANDASVEHELGWNTSTDPCTKPGWTGVTCDDRTNSTRRIVLHNHQFPGSLDAAALCAAPSLVHFSIAGNTLQGGIPPEISQCTQLTHLLLPDNGLSGRLPASLAALNNLKKLDISDNSFSGELPGIARISGLVTFLAQDNHLSGTIPPLQFSNLQRFNVSHNSFSGPVPDVVPVRFGLSSIEGNPGLCGQPLFPACPPPPPTPKGKKSSPSREKLVMYLGYVLLGIAILVFSAYELTQRRKNKPVKKEKEEEAIDTKLLASGKKSSTASMGDHAGGASRSEYSIQSSEGSAAMASASLVVLRNPTEGELRFQDLLRAPAELVGRGPHGSLYGVVLGDGTRVAVKRIKDGGVSAEEFRRRMERVDRARHTGVVPALAFYCSNQEKLVVYEYMHHGSLFDLLHGSQNKEQALDWSSRLSAAASICEALAFMHQELQTDGISHGNLKSSNVLMDAHMRPCISDYGLTAASGGESAAGDPFMADVYGFGVLLLELLTGKVVEGSGVDLARWVDSVVQEEWTSEVFDGALVGEGASEGRMVQLLQVALKCIGSSPDGRPGMKQVAVMISSIRDEEERSTMVSESGESR